MFPQIMSLEVQGYIDYSWRMMLWKMIHTMKHDETRTHNATNKCFSGLSYKSFSTSKQFIQHCNMAPTVEPKNVINLNNCNSAESCNFSTKKIQTN